MDGERAQRATVAPLGVAELRLLWRMEGPESTGTCPRSHKQFMPWIQAPCLHHTAAPARRPLGRVVALL